YVSDFLAEHKWQSAHSAGYCGKDSNDVLSPLQDSKEIRQDHASRVARNYGKVGKLCDKAQFRAFATAISDVKRDDVARLLVHGNPDPLPVGLLLHEALHLVGFRLKTPHDHVTWGRHGLYMQMIRQRLKAGHHEVHEPPDTDPNGATDAVQIDVLAE